ncbi:MAG: nucleotide exchange factor GrpE, partial [Variovorax sp.]
MSAETPQTDPNQLTGDPSPEELEAAQAANEAESQDAQAQLAALQAKNAELADQYLRAQADVQNARRRADEEITKARKFAV